MSFEVKLYRVKKRKNSTFIPDGEAGRTLNCVVKEGTGVLTPVITIANSAETFNPSVYNMAYIEAFSRWYWITDWKNEDNMWTCSLRVDVLATYKTEIADYNYYILRSSTSFDGDIMDTYYPYKPQVNRHISTGEPLWQLESGLDTAGTFVVSIVNKYGISNFYAFTPPQFKAFAQAVFANITWMLGDGISGITDNFAKLCVNPAQYITSVHWLPFSIGGTDMVGMTIGWWDIELPSGLKKLDDSLFKRFTSSVTPVVHPQSSTRGNYLNSSPYRNLRIWIPAFGVMTIDSAKVPSGNTINITAWVDPRTGYAMCTATTPLDTGDVNELLGVLYTNVAVNYQVSDIKTNYTAIADKATSALGSLASSVLNPIGGINGFIKNGIGAIQATGSAEVSTRGTIGSTIGLTSGIYCYSDCQLLVDEDRADNGRPYCKNGKFSTLGNGFYTVENGSTPLNGAYEAEIDEVKNFLESGVYYA